MTDPALELAHRVEERRQSVSARLNARHRSKLGQFFTPSTTAAFLAGLLELPAEDGFRVLDPGAGVGSLSAAVVSRVIAECPEVDLHVVAFEVDELLIADLTATLEDCVALAAGVGCSVTYEVRSQNFVDYATGWLLEQPELFDAVIANPPYKKVSTSAPERVAAESRGLRASNLYTIFVGLAADLLAPGGQMSAIIPRSWANGPYHEPFRRFLLARLSLDFLHVFEARGTVFADAEVLQENVILRGCRELQADTVRLSSSAGADDDRHERTVPMAEVVHPGDPHVFVRIPSDERATRIAEQVAALPCALTDLDITVSTGRVVDFRARESLRHDPCEKSVPLIYPGHLVSGRVQWPAVGSKKPNALHRSAATDALVLPNETYVLVKRFSAKEERRRVVAAVCSPEDVPGAEVGIENHLNVFHRRHHGLPLLLALGLSAYLNTTLVDDFVRSFSGHTQINATDLRQLRYPQVEDLVRLGAALSARTWPEQAELDAVVGAYVPAFSEPAMDLAA